ncbi:MAG: 4'-phosphopantetheinyl transferase superfamily protein [Chloroflexi bacterium]|nr:4'-phosphopantetheinyl transferase superfamily protein [Chloroflexota bacterium]
MITVWRAPLDLPADLLSRCAALLSAEENARAARYRTSELRDRYVAGRGQLRLMLAAATGQPPERLVIAAGERQKPYLPGSDVQFNLAHTDRVMLCAIDRIHPLGVDLEDTRREVEILPIAEQYFAPAEFALLRDAPPDEQRRLFFHLWTRKEAYLKALGVGLFGPLTIPFPLEDQAVFRPNDGDEFNSDDTHWSIVSFTPLPDHLAALVTRAPDPRFTLQEFTAPGF